MTVDQEAFRVLQTTQIKTFYESVKNQLNAYKLGLVRLSLFLYFNSNFSDDDMNSKVIALSWKSSSKIDGSFFKKHFNNREVPGKIINEQDANSYFNNE